MMHPDQLPIDAALVRRLLRAQLPALAALPLTRVASGGTENALFRLGADRVVRLPLRPGKDEQVRKLERWLPELAPALPVAVPVPVAHGDPGPGYPSAWSVCRWLAGNHPRAGSLTNPTGLAEDLAGFIRALSGQEPREGPAPGAHNFFRGVPLARRDVETRRALEQCRGLVPVEELRAVWEDALRAPVWEGPGRWIHGDLFPSNLLVSDGRLCGVLDWGGLGVGDPATDLLFAWNLFGRAERASFRRALGVDDATWRRGRGLAVSVAVVALPYYLETNPAVVRWARRMAGEALADRG